jgi:CubicO group peptidase (beta-lactamase class C family)
MFAKRLVFVLLIVVLALGLLPVVQAQEVSSPDYWPAESWRTSTPEEQGMDSAMLATLVDKLPTYETIDSFMVIRNGYVVTEAYWPPFTKEMDHQWFSVSKSVTSALIGIAVEMGYIANLDEKVISFFPEYTVKNLDDNKQAMTIRDLLTMRSGFACDATTGTDPGDALVTVEDAIRLELDWEMADAPGTTWRYCQINVYLLMAILQRAVGVPVMDFARQYLFTPLGISYVEWATSQQGIPLGFMGLFLTPTDMARFGYLYLMKGRWEDQQIVSSEWVEESTTRLEQGTWDPSASYGYLWWAYSQPGNYFTGIGAQAQFVTVYPEKNLVVVITSSTRDPIGEWTSTLGRKKG